MKIISPLLYYLFILPLSRLPFPVLYGISNGLSFLVFRVFRYRRKVIESNIRGSFPEKSKSEQDLIMRKFFRHFSDLVLESFKLFHISRTELQKRMVFENPELLEPFFKAGKSVIIAGGHYGNWEMFAVAFPLNIHHLAVSVYKKLSDPWFEKVMRNSRSRYGMLMVPTSETKSFFQKPIDRPTATIFGMDQSPSRIDRSHWMTFLGRDTAVIFGTEKYAKEFDQVVVFGRIMKKSRGHFRVNFELITDEPSKMANGKIVERAMELLEKDIRKEPEWWLWTHRRWKHQRPEGA